MSLGKNLQRARKNKGLTQAEVGNMLGVTEQTISGYERDTRDPDTKQLSRLAEIYETTTDYLLGRTDDPTAKNSVLSALFKKFIRLMKDERGAMPPENTLLALTQIAQLYAVSKGVPPSVIADQLSRVNEIPEKEKTRLVDEIDGVLQEETSPTAEYAQRIEKLPEKERKAMEAMLEVLEGRNEGGAAQGS